MSSQSEKPRHNGTVQLSPEEVEEMETLGIATPSQYLKYKLRGDASPQTISIDPMPAKTTGRSVEDAVLIAKQESQIEQLNSAVQQIQNQHHQGLGAIESQISERLDKYVRDREFDDLKKERDEYRNKFENSEKERDELSDRHSEAQSRLGTIDMMKELAPLVRPLLSGLGKGLESAKTNGFAGFLSGFGEAEEVDADKQEADEIAGYLVQLFDDAEREQIKQIIGTFHQDKSMIAKTVLFMQRMLQAQAGGHANAMSAQAPVPNAPAGEELEDTDEFAEQEEQFH